MTRIGPVSIALLCWIGLGFSFAVLLSSAAQADCSQWDVSGEWVFVQTNDTSPNFRLQQSGTELQGSAHYNYLTEDNCILVKCGRDSRAVDASVDGAIKGDSFEVTAYWNNGTTGLYTGKIGPQGRIEGSTYDKQHPQTMANWHSDRTAKCLTSAGGTSGGVSPSSITPPVVGEDTIKCDVRASKPLTTGLIVRLASALGHPKRGAMSMAGYLLRLKRSI